MTAREKKLALAALVVWLVMRARDEEAEAAHASVDRQANEVPRGKYQ